MKGFKICCGEVWWLRNLFVPGGLFVPVGLFVLVGQACFFIGCSASQSGQAFRDSASELRQGMLAEEENRLGEGEAEVPASSTAHYYYILGELSLEADDFDQALIHYEKAVQLEAHPPVTLRRRLAQMYVRKGKLDQALNQVDEALKGANDDFDLLRLRAGILASSHQLEEAILAYRRLIELAPDTQDNYILLASLYSQEGRIPEAKEILALLVRRVPDAIFGHYYLGRVWEVEGNLVEAEKHYRAALSLDMTSDSLQLDVARVLALQGKLGDARTVAEQIVESNPRNVTARKLLGQLLLGQNNLDLALKQFEEVGELEDDPTETRLKIALIKLEQQDYSGAQVELSLVLAEHAENGVARYYLGTSLAALGQTKEAIQEFQKITATQKMFIEAKSYSAYLLRQEKRYEEAEKEVRLALEKNKDDVKLLSFLAAVQHEAGDTDQAVETMNTLIALEPSVDSHYFTLGVFYDESSEQLKAIEAMKRAIDLNSKNTHAMNYLAYTYAVREENLEEALRLVKLALQQEPKNGYFLDTLAWVYYKMARYEEALQQLQQATNYVSDDAVVFEHLGVVQRKLGQRKKALATFQRGLALAPQSDDKEAASRIEIQIGELESELRPQAQTKQGSSSPSGISQER